MSSQDAIDPVQVQRYKRQFFAVVLGIVVSSAIPYFAVFGLFALSSGLAGHAVTTPTISGETALTGAGVLATVLIALQVAVRGDSHQPHETASKVFGRQQVLVFMSFACGIAAVALGITLLWDGDRDTANPWAVLAAESGCLLLVALATDAILASNAEHEEAVSSHTRIERRIRATVLARLVSAMPKPDTSAAYTLDGVFFIAIAFVPFGMVAGVSVLDAEALPWPLLGLTAVSILIFGVIPLAGRVFGLLGHRVIALYLMGFALVLAVLSGLGLALRVFSERAPLVVTVPPAFILGLVILSPFFGGILIGGRRGFLGRRSAIQALLGAIAATLAKERTGRSVPGHGWVMVLTSIAAPPIGLLFAVRSSVGSRVSRRARSTSIAIGIALSGLTLAALLVWAFWIRSAS